MRSIALAILLAGCVEELPGPSGTQSLRVEVLSPTELGSPDERLSDDQRAVTVRVTAHDQRGLDVIDTSFDEIDVDVYVQFLGDLSPPLGQNPFQTILLLEGESQEVTLVLPPVFGPTLLWVEDAARAEATFATGTSPTLWYRDPYVSDISTVDPEQLDFLSASPLQDKQVTVTSSRYGENGRLVVTGVFAQEYQVSDVECADADGTPPCVTGGFDHVVVFTFNRPRDEEGRSLAVGQVIDGFGGAVSEFNGLTEMVFPQTFVSGEPEVDEARLPEPDVIQGEWLLTSNLIELEQREASLVAVEGGVVCDPDEDDGWETFKQWKLDVGNGCDTEDSIAVISTAVVPDFDPHDLIGQPVPRVVGILHPVNAEGLNVWIVLPRRLDDLTF
jgi:hypothetical protein